MAETSFGGAELMEKSELQQNFQEYLKYHVNDRDPRLVEFYMAAILKEAWDDRDEKKREFMSILDNARLRAGI